MSSIPERAVLAVALTIALSACESGLRIDTAGPLTAVGPATSPTGPNSPATGRLDVDTAGLLDGLREAPDGSMAGYDRGLFEHWSDLDRDGCDTRDEILLRDALSATYDGNGCAEHVIVDDAYTGNVVEGRANIDIDHVVSLAEAWRTGAAGWDAAQRERFANDPANLLATADVVNREKGDDGPPEWVPPNQTGWCRYAVTYVGAKATYELTVTAEERGVLRGMLSTCPAG